MNDQLSIFEKRMTVREVAEVLKVNERTIQRYAKDLFPELVQHGRPTTLSELQVTKIKLELQTAKNLDNTVELPKTELEENLLIAQAQNILLSRIERLQDQLKEAQPKIEFYEKVGNAEGLHTMAETAKLLGTGRNRLFDMLRTNSILRHNNEPYQTYINSGYFEVKDITYNVNGQENIKFQTFVTPKGLQWIGNTFFN